MDQEEIHRVRVAYAIGEYDDHDTAAEKVLDQAQIDEIGVAMALGCLSVQETESVKTKFPEVQWSNFTRPAFVRAICEREDSVCFAAAISRARNVPFNHPAWAAVLQYRFDDLPVGLYVLCMCRIARSLH